MPWTINWHMSPRSRHETANRCVRIRCRLWELRIGDLRVYYEIAEDPEQIVTIVAVGVKDRNRVLIGGKEIKL